MSLTGNIHPKVTRGSRVSRAPAHHSLPAFLNLHGRKWYCLGRGQKVKNISNSEFFNRYRRGLETCPQEKNVHKWTRYFLLFFFDASERRVENTRVHFWTFSPV